MIGHYLSFPRHLNNRENRIVYDNPIVKENALR